MRSLSPFAPPFSLPGYCRSRRGLAYGLAVASTLTVSLVLVYLLRLFQTIDEPPAVAFVMPILLAAFAGGFGPGAVATAISGVTVALYDIPRLLTVANAHQGDTLQMVILIGAGLAISAVCEALHRATRHAESAAELKRQVAAIDASAPGAMYSFRLRPEGSMCFPYVSSGFHDVAGLNLADVEHDASMAFSRVHPDDIARLRASIPKSAATMSLWQEEFRMHHPDKGVVWISGTSAPTRQADGSILWYGFFTDVTAHRLADAALARAQKLEALGTLSGGIAHDFNNMLMAMLGNARLVASDLPPDHPAQAEIAEITAAGERAAELVRQILRFSRAADPHRDVVTLESIVHDAERLLRPVIAAGIDMRSTTSPGVPLIAADPTLVHQAIVNLTANAADAIGASGSIEYRVDCVRLGEDAPTLSPELKPGLYARLVVSDSGAGMDRATLARIFDPFFTTKPIGRGTGLGLSVVHGTMRGHGGAVTVESEAGRGTRFCLYFPAVEDTGDVAVAPASSLTSESAPEVHAGAHGGARVLYLDDEPTLVGLAERALDRHGYQVLGYTSPDAALADLRSRSIECDVVVTDLSMPGMSGLEVARRIHLLRPKLPVLLASGRLSPEDETAARAAGVRQVITKPDTIAQLTRALARLFPAPADAAPASELGVGT